MSRIKNPLTSCLLAKQLANTIIYDIISTMGITHETGSIWHEGTKQFLGCMGLLVIVMSLCLGSLYVLSKIQNPVSVSATETPTPIVYFTPTPPTLTPTPQKPKYCVIIDGNNPPGAQGDGSAPTAYSAWEELKRSNKLNFFNLAGPDANPNNPQELDDLPTDLPDVVHNGDKFCLP